MYTVTLVDVGAGEKVGDGEVVAAITSAGGELVSSSRSLSGCWIPSTAEELGVGAAVTVGAGETVGSRVGTGVTVGAGEIVGPKEGTCETVGPGEDVGAGEILGSGETVVFVRLMGAADGDTAGCSVVAGTGAMVGGLVGAGAGSIVGAGAVGVEPGQSKESGGYCEEAQTIETIQSL